MKLVAQTVDVLGARREEYLELRSGGIPILGRTLFVDGLNGDDNGVGKPFKTLTAAKRAALSGDIIHVSPGTYEENDLLKDGVNWHFDAGVIVQYTANGTGDVAGNRGIFDDRSGAVSCKITGKGTFKYTASDSEPFSRGLFVMDVGSTGRIHFEAARLEISLGFDATQAALAIFNCARFHFDIDEIVDLDYSGGVNACSGIYWKKGDMQGRVGFMQVAAYCLYCQEPAGLPTTSIYCRGDYWESNANAIYTYPNDTGVSNLNYRTWLEVLEIKATFETCNFFVGRNYLTAQKVSQTTAGFSGISMQYNTEAWVNIQKLSNNGKGIVTNSGFTGKLFANILHFEDLGSVTNHLELSGTGTAYISGEAMIQSTGQCVEIIGAGNWFIRGYRMEVTTDGAANDCILLGATSSGLVLNNCTLVCGASAQSVELAAARTITNYGSVAKRAVSVAFTLTVNVQALLVDANVA